MPRFAANLSMMFNEFPFEDRFAMAADAGFRAVEYLFPYGWEPDFLAGQLYKHGLTQALFNLYPGDWDKGERGMACIPGREEEFLKTVEQALFYAKVLGCKKVHAMAGIAPEGVDRSVLLRTYKSNIAKAARMLEPHGITLCIEPVSQHGIPGYFLNRQGEGVNIIKEIRSANLKLQFDCFHCQMEEGCVSLKMREFAPYIGHYQIAGVPDRHEPNTGELNYKYLFALMDTLGYDGYVGCEYIPAGKTSAGLVWFYSARRGYAGRGVIRH